MNLLTAVPYSSYTSLIPPSSDVKDKIIYQDTDITAVNELLKFLDKRLDKKTDLVENLSPIITALIRLVKSERLIRKYVRLQVKFLMNFLSFSYSLKSFPQQKHFFAQVLPPLKDVMKRPEEGSTLRAKLCKLLTSPLKELSDLVAEFIFVLCKENGKKIGESRKILRL